MVFDLNNPRIAEHLHWCEFWAPTEERNTYRVYYVSHEVHDLVKAHALVLGYA